MQLTAGIDLKAIKYLTDMRFDVPTTGKIADGPQPIFRHSEEGIQGLTMNQQRYRERNTNGCSRTNQPSCLGDILRD